MNDVVSKLDDIEDVWKDIHGNLIPRHHYIDLNVHFVHVLGLLGEALKFTTGRFVLRCFC